MSTMTSSRGSPPSDVGPENRQYLTTVKMIGVIAMKMPSHAIAPGAGRQAFSSLVVSYGGGTWTIASNS